MDCFDTSTNEERDDLSDEERNVRIFATQMLKSRIFLGQFQERRHVEQLQAYRDVIVVNESESELKKDIGIVRKKLRNFYGSNYWIGLTEPNFIGAPMGHCIWIESEDNTLGNYWYKIQRVRFRRNEIILRVKTIRAMTDNDTSDRMQNIPVEQYMTNLFENFSLETTLQNIKNTILENTLWFFTTVLTINNIKDAVTFLSVFLAASVGLSIKGIGFLMEFFLKFMREVSYFVQSSTPVMLAVVNLCGKVIGGFYLLIAMIWRDSKSPRVYKRYQPYRAIDMPNYRNRPALTITEID